MTIIRKNFNHYSTNFKYVSQKFMNFLIFKLFVGKLLKNGKKMAALKSIYTIFESLRITFFETNELVKDKNNNFIGHKLDGALLFFTCVKILLPIFRIVRKKVSGSIYNLPIPLLKPKQAISKAFKNLISNSFKRIENTLTNKIILEIYDTFHKRSYSFAKKKQDYKVGFKGIPFLYHLQKKRKRTKYNNFQGKILDTLKNLIVLI